MTSLVSALIRYFHYNSAEIEQQIQELQTTCSVSEIEYALVAALQQSADVFPTSGTVVTYNPHYLGLVLAESYARILPLLQLLLPEEEWHAPIVSFAPHIYLPARYRLWLGHRLDFRIDRLCVVVSENSELLLLLVQGEDLPNGSHLRIAERPL